MKINDILKETLTLDGEVNWPENEAKLAAEHYFGLIEDNGTIYANKWLKQELIKFKNNIFDTPQQYDRFVKLLMEIINNN